MQNHVRLSITLTGVLVVAGFLSGCSPSISPLFRDFEASSVGTGQDPIREALESAGWSISQDTTDTYLRTMPRRFNNRGFVASEVYLEVVPMARQHFRIFIYAERLYFFGHRGRIPYLPASLRDAVVPPLAAAFAMHGMNLVTDTVEGR
jgi:hypothetical protein